MNELEQWINGGSYLAAMFIGLIAGGFFIAIVIIVLWYVAESCTAFVLNRLFGYYYDTNEPPAFVKLMISAFMLMFITVFVILLPLTIGMSYCTDIGCNFPFGG